MNETQFERLLNDVEAAQFLQLHPKSVQRMARQGMLPAYRVAKYWRYKVSELVAWVETQKNGCATLPAPEAPPAPSKRRKRG